LNSVVWVIGKMADGLGLVSAAASDALQVMKNIATLDVFAENVSGIDNYLDLLDKRDAERAAAKSDLGGLEGIKPVADAAEAVEKLADNSKELKRQAKEAADALKQQERAAEALRTADLSRMQSALKNAQAHFAAGRQTAMTRAQQPE